MMMVVRAVVLRFVVRQGDSAVILLHNRIVLN